MKKRQKGYLVDGINSGKIPIWINKIVDGHFFPVKFEYRGLRGYKGLEFSEKLNRIEIIEETKK